MNHNELLVDLSTRLGWALPDVAEMLSAMTQEIELRLLENDSISFPDFGQFEAKKKEERLSVNPTNGKRFLIPPKLTPIFKPSNTLKAKLK